MKGSGSSENIKSYWFSSDTYTDPAVSVFEPKISKKTVK